VLLIALLPNVGEIFLHGVSDNINALTWRPQHGFAALRRATACTTDGELQWPLAFFLLSLDRGKPVTLRVSRVRLSARTFGSTDPAFEFAARVTESQTD
jgi:hypothetical protein